MYDMVKKLKQYLIQGFFFQNISQLSFYDNWSSPDGFSVFIKSGLFKFMYAGIIFTNPEAKTELIGEMSDHFGKSKLFEIIVTDKVATFIKKYDCRNDLIKYCFKRDGNIWTGEYSGKATGKGGAKCIITEVPKDLFLPPK